MYKLTFLAIIPLALCRAQAPATDPQHASLAGQVVSITGEPLRKVTLRLQSTLAGGSGVGGITVGADGRLTLPQMPAVLTAQSDTQGNFVFENLDPGRYNLSAERAGYIRENYTPAGGNGLLALTAGQRMTGIGFKLTPESAISGRVFDADGDPLPKARVTVLRMQYSYRGKQLFPAGNAQTSLDGSFRVEGLTAGRYYVSAQDQQTLNLSSTTQAASKVPEEGYVTTYYPSAIQFSSATPIVVAAGVESRGIDIRLAKTRVFHVRGKVLDVTTGTVPPGTLLLRISPKDSLELLAPILPGGFVRNGTFDFGGLAPGDYILQSSPGTSRAADGTTTTISVAGRQIVSVGSSDVDDITFRLMPGAEVTGKISTEPGSTQQQQQQPGQAPAAGSSARPIILLTPMEGTMGASNANPKDDGTFAIHGVPPGVYQLQVASVAPGLYLKYIRFGNQDITRSTLDLTSGAGATLDVLLSPNSADVSGTLHGSDGAPLAGVNVTLWTAGAAQSGIFYQPKNSRTDANGAFKFTGLGPGDYRVAAWDVTDVGILQVPEFRARFESKAAKVKLSENSHETVDAPLIPRDAIDAAAAELR